MLRKITSTYQILWHQTDPAAETRRLVSQLAGQLIKPSGLYI
jgi:hypothetical protein